MVGLVVVGHSRALARAAVALASEMVPGAAVPIEIAAGLDETTFGTDATAIMAAIAGADRGDGVVVLMDLGSAVLSAELALELLDDDVRERVVLSPAPIVEGLVAAAVSAAGGASRQEIAAEAAGALAGKQSQLGAAPGGPAPADPAAAPGRTEPGAPGDPAAAPGRTEPGAPGDPAAAPGRTEPGTPGDPAGASGRTGSAEFVVTNPHGLHARPAARLVAEARAFDAEMDIRNRTTGSGWVPAGSLSRVATLGARAGHSVEIRARGPQAREAVDAVAALAGRAFDETTSDAPADPGATPPQPAGAAGGPAMTGRAASPGIGIGRVRRLDPGTPEIPDAPSRGPAAERQRFDEALNAVRGDIERVRAATERDLGSGAAQIFDAHRLLLDDPELLGDVRGRIDGGQAAPPAWAAAAARIADEFEAMDDAYLRARAADVRAVRDQVLRALLGVPAHGPASPAADPGPGTEQAAGVGVGTEQAAEPGPGTERAVGVGVGTVVVAAELTPADAATLEPARVAGVLLASGSPTSHGAILARTRGIPAVVGLGPPILQVGDGTLVALDGGTGEVIVAPGAAVVSAFEERAAARAADRSRAAARAAEPAVTRDGVTIAVGANIGSLADARAAAAHGADLAGLVRTEFLFLDRDAPPDVDEQEAAYRAIASALDRRVTLRTLDVGGDKPLRYLPGPAEDNPFLGVRGLRHSLAHPDLLAGQLLAMVRVARDAPVSIMFPMVSAVDEVIAARSLLEAAVARAGSRPAGLRVGIMMEVPAAALKAAAFAPYVDFVSIGTNDLTQYALAAERGNPALAALADGLDPGVLALIERICAAAAFEVAVCGELAGDPAATPILAGLGVREFSMAPPAIPVIKERVRTLDLAAAAAQAAHALAQPSAAAVRRR